MYYITIDCGTTNSRAYVVTENGNVIGKARKNVGVKDTSITGTKETLEKGLCEVVESAVADAGVKEEEIQAVFSSGMITSEIGLCELPHLTAPCGVEALADTIQIVEGLYLYKDKPVYFVRGIKNSLEQNACSPFEVVGNLDFMRGEETQVMGILKKGMLNLPAAVVVLSSHTKVIPIDENGRIIGSLSTMSGQMHEAVGEHTFLGKSLIGNKEEVPEAFFDEAIVEAAANWVERAGISRAFMFPRFLDVLLDTKWYERKLFFEALIAAEDMISLKQLSLFMSEVPRRFMLVGKPGRCELYRHILKKIYGDVEIFEVSEMDEIDSLSIFGILDIARKAGIVQ